MQHDKETQSEIYDAIQESDTDLSIQDVADKTGYSRKTVEKWIEVLNATGRITCTRTIGRARMFNTKD